MIQSTRPIQMFIQWCKSLPERSSLENRDKLEITILSCHATSWICLLTSPLHALKILIVQMKTFFFIPLFLSPPLLPSCTNLVSHYFTSSLSVTLHYFCCCNSHSFLRKSSCLALSWNLILTSLAVVSPAPQVRHSQQDLRWNSHAWCPCYSNHTLAGRRWLTFRMARKSLSQAWQKK